VQDCCLANQKRKKWNVKTQKHLPMKKFLLICLIVFTVKTSNAQSWVYHPFPADSATWMQESVVTDSYLYSRTYLMGDTIIGSNIYHKIYSTSSWGWFSSSYYPGSVGNNIIGALREQNKKIYFYDGMDGTEKLLYNFNLNPGDIAFIDSTFSQHDTIVVTGSDSILIGGAYHKVLILENLGIHNYGVPANWIEGVGSDAGLFEKYRYGFEFGNQLVCFAINNEWLYHTSSLHPYDCKDGVGISEQEGNKVDIKVGPNPTSGMTHLAISCNDRYQIDVINNIGELIISKRDLQLSGTFVDLSSFSKGVYLIRLIDSKGNSVTKKIVKE
jgi:hypothetical protein